MEIETLNKLYCELSNFVTAKSAREIALEKQSTARIEYLEHLYHKYNHAFYEDDLKVMRALLAEYKPERYTEYK